MKTPNNVRTVRTGARCALVQCATCSHHWYVYFERLERGGKFACPKCFPRVNKLPCNECGGMPWRVIGPKCKLCGNRHAAEQIEPTDAWRRSSEPQYIMGGR